MGAGVGLILIAGGAILTWGVDATVSGLNVTAIGVTRARPGSTTAAAGHGAG